MIHIDTLDKILSNCKNINNAVSKTQNKEITIQINNINTELNRLQNKIEELNVELHRKRVIVSKESEDILEAAKPFLLKHGVYFIVNEEIVGVDHVPMLQSTATISDGENPIHATISLTASFSA